MGGMGYMVGKWLSFPFLQNICAFSREKGGFALQGFVTALGTPDFTSIGYLLGKCSLDIS